MRYLSRRTFIQNVSIGIGAATLPSFVNIANVPPMGYNGKKINFALCGFGRYAGYLAAGLQTTEYCRLAGIVTGHPAKAVEWKAKYNIPEANIYDYGNFDN